MTLNGREFPSSLVATLAAVTDAFLPSLPPIDTSTDAKDPASTRSFKQTVHPKETVNSELLEAITRKLQHLPSDGFDELVMLLRAMSTSAGNMCVTGYARPFTRLAAAERESAMQAMSKSMVPDLRKAFRGLKALACMSYFELRDSWAAIGYSGPDDGPESPRVYKHGYNMETITEDTAMTVDVVVVGSG